MKSFKRISTQINKFVEKNRIPDFNNLLKILNKKTPERLTLFEFFLNSNLEKELTLHITFDESDPFAALRRRIDAFKIAGYDYVTVLGSDFNFNTNKHERKRLSSLSLNDGAVITDRNSFDNFNWPEPEIFDYSRLDKLASYLPDGMKFIVHGPGGVLENVISLIGYDNLCFMLVDSPDLVKEIFDGVGLRLVKYYEICRKFDSVGALISNDDWGFNTQTLMSVRDMRKYVMPWHKKIVQTIHLADKPAILHSCGNIGTVMDDVINEIKYDGKHSFQDNIQKVEDAYKEYGEKIAILGGIDIDFICRSAPEVIYKRSCQILEMAENKGGYALGSGNSIPEYVPVQNYLAMIAAAVMN